MITLTTNSNKLKIFEGKYRNVCEACLAIERKGYTWSAWLNEIEISTIQRIKGHFREDILGIIKVTEEPVV